MKRQQWCDFRHIQMLDGRRLPRCGLVRSEQETIGKHRILDAKAQAGKTANDRPCPIRIATHFEHCSLIRSEPPIRSAPAKGPVSLGTKLCGPTFSHTRISRSEENKSELKSLMQSSYAVSCLKRKKTKQI